MATLALAQGPSSGRRHGQGLPKDLPPVLRKAFASAFKLRYSAERVVSFRRGPDRRQHVEYVIKDGPRIRIWFPSDSAMAGQVIVENGTDRQHYLPSSNEIHVGPAMHDDAFDKLRYFLRDVGPNRLRVLTGNGEDVAGLKTSVVSFMTSKGNIVQKLWIDERSGLIAKREMYDPAGGLVGSFEFKKINFSPSIRPDDFSIKARATIVTQEDLAKRSMAKAGLLPAFLPEEGGRRLIGSRLMDRNPASIVLILTYDLGRSTVSLFQVKGQFEPDRLNRMARGEFKTYSWQLQGRTFALIGEVDLDTLKRLADKVQIRPES